MSDDDRIVLNKFNREVTSDQMKCLLPDVWLNDEMINVMMEMYTVLDKCKSMHDLKYKFKYMFETCKRVFFPINTSNTHWKLLELCLFKNNRGKYEMNYHDYYYCDDFWGSKRIGSHTRYRRSDYVIDIYHGRW